VLISDDDVRAAIRRLATGNKVIAEGAGALAVAAAVATPVEQRGLSVAIVTGGSIDLPLLQEILGS
jgi:threonine dehydratase